MCPWLVARLDKRQHERHKFIDDYRQEMKEEIDNHRQLSDFYKVSSGGRSLDQDVDMGIISDRTMSAKNRINAAFNMAGPALATSSPQSAIASAPAKGRVFWSGGDNALNAATSFAKSNGFTTLEMTTSGKVLIWATKKTSYSFTKPFWTLASKRFASGAAYEVNVFIDFNKLRDGSIWFRYEQPILQSKDVPIFYHSVK